MPRVIPRPRGFYNARLGRGLMKVDPTRTGRLRKLFSQEIRRHFSDLFLATWKLLEQDYTLNVFCPTGEGGGVDPTCSPKGMGWRNAKEAGLDPETVFYRGMSKEAFEQFKQTEEIEAGHRANIMSTDPETAAYYASEKNLDEKGVVVRFKVADLSDVEQDEITNGDFRVSRKTKVRDWEVVENLASTQFNIEQQNLIDDIKHIQSLLDPNDVVELEEHPHITVRYGLHGQEADQVQSLYRNTLPIRVKLRGLSLFPAGEASSLRGGPQYDVLKIDVESRALPAIHQRLGLLPNTSTHSTYHPHLTVAYLKPGTGIKYVGESGLEGTELTFDKLVFSNDEREHTVLENAFCPTGPGGGQDNSCPPNKGSVLSQVVKEYGPILAISEQDGYTLRIHDSHPGTKGSPVLITDDFKSFSGAGQMTIQSPDGEIVVGGKWMDWAEEEWSLDYKKLPKRERANLEAQEQLKWGLKKNFQFHKDRGGLVENAFCPTGPGGGQDNSCSPANKGGGSAYRDGDRYFRKEDIEAVGGYKSRDILVHMSPSDFLRVAEHLDEGPSEYKQQTVLGVLSRGEQFHDIPILSFDHDGQGTATVAAHEGRHRMMALQSLGVTSVPVRFTSREGGNGRGIRWDQQEEPTRDRIQGKWPAVLKGQGNMESIPFPVSDLREATEWEHTVLENAFCPTGPGGGQDNSCSPSNKGGGIRIVEGNTVEMSPQTYLALAAPFGHQGGPEADMEKAKRLAKMDKWDTRPMLSIKEGDGGKLQVGLHDGRHRALAAIIRGDAKIQVDLVRGKRFAREHPEETDISIAKRVAKQEVLEAEYGGSVTLNARTVDQHVKRFLKDHEANVKRMVKGKRWWVDHVNGGFQTGMGRAYDDQNKPLTMPADKRKEYNAKKRQFLKSTAKAHQKALFGQYAKVEDDLDRITKQLGQKLKDYLIEERAKGRTLRDAAKEILPKLEKEGLRRADNVAQYRTIEAHAEGQLAAFEEMGVEEISVMVEWMTAGDERVCPMCDAMEGVVLRPQDAHGLIPRHLHCRCSFELLGSEGGVDEEDRITTRRGIREAIKASIKQERRKQESFKEARKRSTWSGKDAEFKGRPLFNLGITPELLQFSEFATNVFCPTGEGGGVDPTCSPSSTTKGGEDLYSASRGKDKVWRLANGQPAPEHIQKLGIPPGWKDVEINPNPKGMTYAKGIDAKGRVQTKYSNSFRAQQDAAKFGRTRELLQKREQIFKELDRDAKNPELKEQAECLKLVMQTGMRPGSDKDTKADHQSYGATTLEGRHVLTNRDGTVTLRLVTGKNKGREVDFPVTDKATASMLKARAKAAGKSGRLFATSAASLRDYSKTKDGGGFKTKDHRTALGTETALRVLKGMSKPTNMPDYKGKVKAVAAVVAKALGNTPPIALKSYIDPHVFSAWNKGLKK